MTCGSMVWPAAVRCIPGDIVATLIWVILAAIITVLAWPHFVVCYGKCSVCTPCTPNSTHHPRTPFHRERNSGLELSTSPSVRRCPRYADTTANRAEPTELIFLSRRFSEKTDPTLGDS